MSITQPVCVCVCVCVCAFVALGIQHATRMRHIVICGLTRSAISFHMISETVRISKKKNSLNTKCVSPVSLQLLPEIFLILKITERDMIEDVQGVPGRMCQTSGECSLC